MGWVGGVVAYVILVSPPVPIGLGFGFWTGLGLGLGLRGPDLGLGLELEQLTTLNTMEKSSAGKIHWKSEIHYYFQTKEKNKSCHCRLIF